MRFSGSPRLWLMGEPSNLPIWYCCTKVYEIMNFVRRLNVFKYRTFWGGGLWEPSKPTCECSEIKAGIL